MYRQPRIIDKLDTVRCIQLACENPADKLFRVFNEITEFMSLRRQGEDRGRASPDAVQVEHVASHPSVEARQPPLRGGGTPGWSGLGSNRTCCQTR